MRYVIDNLPEKMVQEIGSFEGLDVANAIEVLYKAVNEGRFNNRFYSAEARRNSMLKYLEKHVKRQHQNIVAEQKAAEEALAKAVAEAKATREAIELAAKEAKAKAVAEAKAKKEAEELAAELEIRKSEFDGMVKAGIPEEIVNLWVNGDLAKGDMFFMLKTLGRDALNLYNEEMCKFINPDDSKSVPRYFDGDIRENISLFHSLMVTNHETLEWTWNHPSLVDKKLLQFLIKCEDNDDDVWYAIINDEIDLEYAYKLVNDLGFDEHPEALKEVIEGANWEAVAVKHGFLQFD